MDFPSVRITLMVTMIQLFAKTSMNLTKADSTLTFTTTNKSQIESALETIHSIHEDSKGVLCVTEHYRTINIPVNTFRYESARQRVDMAALLIIDLGYTSQFSELPDAIARNLLLSDSLISTARVLILNATNGRVLHCSWWVQSSIEGPGKVTNNIPEQGTIPDVSYPWYEDPLSRTATQSPKFMDNPANVSFKGWWTYPYYCCGKSAWLISYSVPIISIHKPEEPAGVKGFISIDVDVTNLEVNQCDEPDQIFLTQNEMQIFHGSHKCHNKTSKCHHKLDQPISIHKNQWIRGNYQCKCRDGFYSAQHHGIFDGQTVEVAWQARRERDNAGYSESKVFMCKKCAYGCKVCADPKPCLATYNWSFRISLLVISLTCAFGALVLILYMFRHRRLKVFKVASPCFLAITLIGCCIMYLEMVAIFPVLDTYSCIATKWTRHLGFCVTYTALLMKTWRVSLTYRVKSAHKIKLTDKQLLQWMMPILLVMLIYLSTWTLSGKPSAEDIKDGVGLLFKQCVYNWWDHCLVFGEVLFLAWGIRVCYNVRHAESLYNEARLISYAIYNIALVNTVMIAFHLFIFPNAGPDTKYLLGFIRTQMSTTVTILLVFGPKVLRVIRGQGDQWDNKARARAVTASFSLNGMGGLVGEETQDLYQENEELKEEIQKLAAQMEFMKIVHMETNNRHLKPKPSGYFNVANMPVNLQSPISRTAAVGAGVFLTRGISNATSSDAKSAAGSIAERV